MAKRPIKPKERKRPYKVSAKPVISHKGKAVPAPLEATYWKPGQCGNPNGRPPGTRPKKLIDHLNDYYAGTIGRPGEEITRLEAQAKLVGGLALGVVDSGDPALRRDSQRAVLERLAPVEQQRAEPFVELHIHSTDEGRTFLAMLSESAGALAVVTPSTVLAALQKRGCRDSAESSGDRKVD
jgi:hypothetical protein